MTLRDRVTTLRAAFREQFSLLLGVVILLFLLEGYDTALGGALDQYGVIPHDPSTFLHIFSAPFLHVGFGHLLANTIPFLLLGGLVLLHGRQIFVVVSLVAILLSGLGAWVFGAAGTIHLGASGVIFGYFGYLVGRVIFDRTLAALLLAPLVLIVYGNMLAGILPGVPGISWQMHFFGLVGGLLAARLLGQSRQSVRQ